MGRRRLKTDEEFKHLIRPLRQREYTQLEQNILSDGCRDPIVVWNDVIVDGHNRYEICMRQSAWKKKHYRGNPQISDWNAV